MSQLFSCVFVVCWFIVYSCIVCQGAVLQCRFESACRQVACLTVLQPL